MSSVDNRIVNMQFNNSQFEAGVSQTIGTLDKLKSSLKLDNAALDLSKITKAVNSVDLSKLEAGVQSLQNRFSTLGVAGMTAIQNLTNRAVNAGVRFVKGLTVDPILDGFNELETKNKAITTIMANVGEHNTIDEVTAALDELNTYADKTIYNFSEMTQNIGRFTAAGVDLKTSVTGIKGMSNLAAFFGADNTQAQRAMYQMSQALATGTIRLMDWNSMVQASMGGTALSDLLVQIGDKMGMGASEAIAAEGSFRESLKTGWLTNDVFMKGLSYFSQEVNDGNEAMLRQQYIAEGWSEEMADHLLYLGKTANDAATRVRSYRQMMDTMSEEVGSSWSQTFELILGGYNGSTKFWDDIYQSISPALSLMGNLRNSALMSWVNAGGQTSLMTALRQVLGTVDENGNPVNGNGMRQEMLTVGNAFAEVMGLTDAINKYTDSDPAKKLEIGMTPVGQYLTRFSTGLQSFTKNIQLSDSGLKNWGDTWKAIASILGLGAQALGFVVSIASQVVGALAPIREIVLALVAPFARIVTTVIDWISQFDLFAKVSDLVGKGFQAIHDGLEWVADGITWIFDTFDPAKLVRGVLDFFTNLVSIISGFFTGGIEGLDFGTLLFNIFGGAALGLSQIPNLPIFQQLGSAITSGFQAAFDYVSSYFSGAKNFTDILDGVKALGKDTYSALAEQFNQGAPIVAKSIDTMIGTGIKAIKDFAYGVQSQSLLHDRIDAQGGASSSIPKTGNMLVDLAVTAHDVFREIRQMFGVPKLDLFSGLVSAAKSAVEFVKGYFSEAKSFEDYFEGAKALGKALSTMLVDKFKEVRESLPGIWSNFQEQFAKATDYVQEHAKDIPEVTRTMAQRVSDYMRNLVARFQDSGIGNSLGGVFEGIKEKALSIVDFFVSHRMDIWDAIKNFGNAISEGAKNFLPSVIDWLDDFFGRIISKFSNAANNGIFDRIGKAFGDAGSTIAEGFTEFFTKISDSFTAFGDFVKNNPGMQVIGDIPITDIAMVAEMIAIIAVINQVKQLLVTLNTSAKDVSKIFQDGNWLNKGPLGWGKTLTKHLSSFIDEWGKVGTSISTAITKTTRWVGLSMFLKALAPVLLEVAGLAGLAMVDPEAVKLAAIVVGALAGLFGAIMLLGNAVGGKDKVGSGAFDAKGMLNIGSMIAGLIGMAATVWLLSTTVKKLGKLDSDEIEQGLMALAGIMSGLVLAVGSISYFGKSNKTDSGIGKDVLLSMIGVAVAALAISSSISSLGKLPQDALLRGFGVLSIIFGEVIGLAALGGRISKGNSLISTFGTLVGFAVAARVVAGAFKSLAKLEWEDIGKGFVAMGSCLLAVGAAMGIMSLISMNGDVQAKGFAGIAVSILAIAAAFKILQGVDWGTIGVGFTAIAGMLGILTGFSVLYAVFSGLQGPLQVLTNTLLKLGAAAALFGLGAAGIAAFVGMLNDLKTAITGEGIGESFARLVNGIIDGFGMVQGKLVTFIIGFFVSVIESLTDYAGRLVTAIGDLLVAVFENLAQVTPRVVAAFKGFVESLFGEVQNQFGDIDWDKFGEMFDHLVAVPMLTAVVGKLLNVKFSDIAKVAAAIILTVGPIVAAISFLSQVGNSTGIEAMEAIDNIIQAVGAISVLMGVLFHLSGITVKSMGKGGAALGLGIDALVGIVGLLSYAIGFLNIGDEMREGLDVMNETADFISQFSAEFVILAAAIGSFGGGESILLLGAGGLAIGAAIDGLMIIVSILQTAFGFINNVSGGGFVDNLKSGAEVFQAIGEGLGSIIGGFVGGIMSSASDAIPEVAKNVDSAFSTLMPVFDEIANMDPSVMTGLQTFADAMTTFGSMDFLFTGLKLNSIQTFAEGLSDIGSDLNDFASKIEPGNLDRLSTGMEAIKGLAEFAKDLPDSGQWNFGQLFVGRKQTLQEFTDGMKDFYPAIKEAIDTFGSEGDLDTSGLEEAITVAQKVSDLQNGLQGGQGASLGSFFVGRQQDLGEFAFGLSKFIYTIQQAAETLGSADALDLSGFTESLDVVKDILENIVPKLPQTESLGSALVGGISKNLGTFGSEIADLSGAMKGINESWKDVTFDKYKLTAIIDVVTSLAEASNKMPHSLNYNILGIASFHEGADSLGQFCADISAHSTEIGDLVTSLSGVQVNSVQSARIQQIGRILSSLAEAQGNLVGVDIPTSGDYDTGDKVQSLSQFITSLNNEDFLTSLKSFIEKLQQFTPSGNLDNITTVTDTISALVAAYTDLPPELDTIQTDDAGNKIGRFTNLADQFDELAIGLAALSNVGYDDRSGQFNERRLQNVTDMVAQVQGLASAYETIMRWDDGDGGVNQAQSWTNFTTSLTSLGKGLQDFSLMMGGFDLNDPSKRIGGFNINRISTAVDRVQELAGLVDDGGLLENFDKTSFENFNDAIVGDDGLGPTLKQFITDLETVVPDDDLDNNTEHLTDTEKRVQKAIGMVKDLAALVSGDDSVLGANNGTSGFDPENNVLTQFTDFFSSLSGYDITNNVTKVQELLASVKELAGKGQGYTSFGAPTGDGIVAQLRDLFTVLGSSDISGAATSVQTMADALSKLGSTDADGNGAVTTIEQLFEKLSGYDWTTLTTGISGFSDAINGIADGITSASEAIGVSIEGMIQNCITILADANQRFFDSGELSATNYANGIGQNGSPQDEADNMAGRAASAAQGHYMSFYAAGSMAASGMAAGIRSKASEVAQEAANMVKDAISAAEAAQDSNSPSREYAKLGVWAVEGYASGMEGQRERARQSAYQLVKGALDYAYSMAQSDMEMHPVIEPVLNLDAFRTDATEMSALLNDMNTTALAHSVGAASAVARQMRQNQEIQNESTEEPSTTTVNNTFTQNITSPKAVSRMDVYRDTRNLFALEKGAAVKEKGVYTR